MCACFYECSLCFLVAQDTTHSSVIFCGGIESLAFNFFTLTFQNSLMVGVLAEMEIKGVIWCEIVVADNQRLPLSKMGPH